MLRIATVNVNGIRACVRRGFRDWLDQTQPDVVALQEVRCPVDQLPMDAFEGYHLRYDAGQIPGRNGVAVLSRGEPTAARAGVGAKEFDSQGRYIEVDLPAADGRPGLTVGSLYLPKGAAPDGDEAAQAKYHHKMRFLATFARVLTASRRRAQREGREFIVMGDFNVAHAEADLKNFKSNRKSEGFLPEEREWFSTILGARTLHDVVRELHPEQSGPYSWWSWRGQSFVNDVGWRIDYHLASPRLAAAAITGGSHRAASYEGRMSDHCPVVVDYDF